MLVGVDGSALQTLFLGDVRPGSTVGVGLFPALSGWGGCRVRCKLGRDLGLRPFRHAPPAGYLPCAAATAQGAARQVLPVYLRGGGRPVIDRPGGEARPVIGGVDGAAYSRKLNSARHGCVEGGRAVVLPCLSDGNGGGDGGASRQAAGIWGMYYSCRRRRRKAGQAKAGRL
jgi:hypothetical protein